MTSDEQYHGGGPMVREASSSSCASQASLQGLHGAGGGNGHPKPYINVLKTQLNFFMTRLLFMEDENVDSLGATATATRRQKKLNDSMNSSFGGGDSSARLGGSNPRLGGSNSRFHGSAGGAAGGFGGLDAMMEADEEDEDDGPLADVQVIQDNARILPDCYAKSMPPVPFPPAAPESPRPLETKHGLAMTTPTHHSAAGRAAAVQEALRAPSMPDLMEDSCKSLDDRDQLGRDDDADDDEDESDRPNNTSNNDTDEPELLDDDDGDRKPAARATSPPPPLVSAPAAAPATTPTTPRKVKESVPNVPPEKRIFPKNLRRNSSKNSRSSSSRSVGANSKESKSSTDDANLGSSSCHANLSSK
jgi:hypothetical protein